MGLKAKLEQGGRGFEAKLTHVAGRRIASGSDFDESTGGLKSGANVQLLQESEARALADKVQQSPWTVDSVEEKPTVRKPVPPFTTSTLQPGVQPQVAPLSAGNDALRSGGLYERGFITYMRTDSVHLSDQAISASRSCVQSLYGKGLSEPRTASIQHEGTQCPRGA